jgi:peroxiredoxin Q/BCP
VAVYGVSFDSVEDNREFAEDQAFPFPLLCDVNRELAMGLGVVTEADASWANRMTFIVDAEGQVVHAEETKDPSGQAEALLELLR